MPPLKCRAAGGSVTARPAFQRAVASMKCRPQRAASCLRARHKEKDDAESHMVSYVIYAGAMSEAKADTLRRRELLRRK